MVQIEAFGGGKIGIEVLVQLVGLPGGDVADFIPIGQHVTYFGLQAVYLHITEMDPADAKFKILRTG